VQKADVATLYEAIERDRATIRANLLESLPETGRVDRDRLRRILAADRAQLYRTEGARNSAEFVAALFHVSKWKAQRWIAAAHALEHLPHISGALEAGSLSLDKTVELTRFATPQTERKLITWARRVTVGCIRHKGDEAIAASKKEIEDIHQERRLEWWWSDRALAFEGTLSAEQGAAFIDAIDRLAHELPEDPDSPRAFPDDDAPPSMPQRRADALVLLATSTGPRDTAVPGVVVHVPVEALTNGEGNGVTGSGAVLHPELVRMLACDSRIQAVLEDPLGHPLGIGHESRTPPRWLRRMVLARDGHACTFPGCGMKRFLHLHHIEHWPTGPTEYSNLVTVCSVHHSLIHKLGWDVALEDGEAAWFRPRGVRFEPGPAPPDPPPRSVRSETMLGEAAGYSRMFDLLGLMARRDRPRSKPAARSLRAVPSSD